ncbi:hypothetical protein QFC22_003362 [Naganishia vaughanmartiniae]|uniref:Uncharacterized protein n=1 Tax=Naganishia vaughanmartiniae TaxID=1424756 RepID=A0ACC2X8P5_9TREE|nr:hypothetical protein QFC22_003362 [Naganishia vaughanmartiniae]
MQRFPNHLEEIQQNATYLSTQGNLPATPYHHLEQNLLCEYLAPPALSLDVGAPLVESWEMALQVDTAPSSNSPTPEESTVAPDDGAIDSLLSRPITMEEKTESDRLPKRDRRTSVLGSFLFTSKSAKGLSVDDEDKPLTNGTQPEKLRKLFGRLSLPPSPRSAINISWGSINRGNASGERKSTARESSGSISRPRSTLSVSHKRSSDTLQYTLKLRKPSGQPTSTSKSMEVQPPDARRTSQSSTASNNNSAWNTLRASQSTRRHQGTLVGTPGGTIYGLGELGEHSMPLPLFRRPISDDALNDPTNSYVQSTDKLDLEGKDTLVGAKGLDDQDSAECLSVVAAAQDALESRESFFTEASVLRTTSTSTAPTSTVPSSHPGSAICIEDMDTLLSTQPTGVAGSASGSWSRESPRRPGIQRSSAFRREARDKLFDALSPEDQMALEDMINAEAMRRCRQVLIEIDDDVVFEKAMSHALRNQWRSQALASNTMVDDWQKVKCQMVVPKDAIKPSFLAREILRGERSYKQHLEHGVTPYELRQLAVSRRDAHSLSDNFVELSKRNRLGRQVSIDFRPDSAKVSASRSLRGLSLFDDGPSKTSSQLKQAVAADCSERSSDSPRTKSYALVIYHFQKLIEVSRKFVVAMEHEPDPYSIAVSFCESYGGMEDVYGDWAEVVGDLIHQTMVPVSEVKLVHSLSQPGLRRKLSKTAYSSPKIVTAATVAGAWRSHLPDIMS